jgi:uncharacterized protein (TIGR02996 family)
MGNEQRASLLQAIREQPDDDAPREVYADWLLEQGDVRGEFIRIQCELARSQWDGPERDRLLERQQELQERYQTLWLGSVDHPSLEWCFYRGFPNGFRNLGYFRQPRDMRKEFPFTKDRLCFDFTKIYGRVQQKTWRKWQYKRTEYGCYQVASLEPEEHGLALRIENNFLGPMEHIVWLKNGCLYFFKNDIWYPVFQLTGERASRLESFRQVSTGDWQVILAWNEQLIELPTVNLFKHERQSDWIPSCREVTACMEQLLVDDGLAAYHLAQNMLLQPYSVVLEALEFGKRTRSERDARMHGVDWERDVDALLHQARSKLSAQKREKDTCRLLKGLAATEGLIVQRCIRGLSKQGDEHVLKLGMEETQQTGDFFLKSWEQILSCGDYQHEDRWKERWAVPLLGSRVPRQRAAALLAVSYHQEPSKVRPWLERARREGSVWERAWAVSRLITLFPDRIDEWVALGAVDPAALVRAHVGKALRNLDKELLKKWVQEFMIHTQEKRRAWAAEMVIQHSFLFRAQQWQSLVEDPSVVVKRAAANLTEIPMFQKRRMREVLENMVKSSDPSVRLQALRQMVNSSTFANNQAISGVVLEGTSPTLCCEALNLLYHQDPRAALVACAQLCEERGYPEWVLRALLHFEDPLVHDVVERATHQAEAHIQAKARSFWHLLFVEP